MILKWYQIDGKINQSLIIALIMTKQEAIQAMREGKLIDGFHLMNGWLL